MFIHPTRCPYKHRLFAPEESRIGMDISNQLIRIASTITAPKGQEYTVLITIFTQEIQEDKGHGIQYVVGAYPEMKTCEKIRKTLVNEYQIKPEHITIVDTCKWIPLRPNFDGPKGTEGSENPEGSKEQPETTTGSEGSKTLLDEYIYKIYLTIKHKTQIDELKQELPVQTNKYDQLIQELRIMTKEHPEFKDTWIPVLTKRMTENGDLMALNQILEEYKNLDL